MYYIIGVVILIVLVIIYMGRRGESFSTRREKADAIYTWFADQSAPRYVDFKRDLKKQSNIVDYELSLRLKRSPGRAQ